MSGSGIITPLFTTKAKLESFYLGRFLSPSSSESDSSIFKSWIQNRLKEYFAKRAERHRRIKDKDYSVVFKHEDVDIFQQELRVLDVAYLPDCVEIDDDDYDTCVTKGIQCTSTDPIYETGVKRVIVTFQHGPQSPAESLHLVTRVGEVLNVELADQNMHPYIPYSEKHLIDVHTQVLPMLENWAKTQGLDLKLPVATCYYAKHEDSRQINVDELPHVEDDLMSKVAAGIALDKQVPVFESHRIIILGDVRQNGFTRKNSTGSSFLPLLNVHTTVQEIAKIHCISWAFGEITKKRFEKVWPLFAQKTHVSYILSRARIGLPILINLTDEYLQKHKSKDSKSVLDHLQSLQGNLRVTLQSLPSTISGPQTLIHQGLNFSTVLFRHSYLPLQSTESVSKKSRSRSSDKNAGAATGSGSSDAEQPSKSRSFMHRFQIRKSNFLFNKPKSSTSSLPLVKRDVCIIGWKNATFGSPMMDIAFLLLTSLPPKMRKGETSAILKLYWEEFAKMAAKFGLKNGPWDKKDALLSDFWRGVLYGCLIIASNVTSDSHLGEDEMEIFVEGVRDLISWKII